MPNPYNITEVNVPGILSAYQDRQNQRLQQLLVQRKIAAEDRAIEKESALAKAYGSIRLPGMSKGAEAKGGDQASGVGGAYAPPASTDTGDLSSGVSLAYAPKVTPEMQAMADEEYGAAPAAPQAEQPPQLTPQDQTWLQANGDVVQQVMGLDPVAGLQLYKQFQTMDETKLKQVADAQEALVGVAYSLRSLPYAQRRAALAQAAPQLMRQHPGMSADIIQNFDPTDQNLDMFAGQALGVKGMVEHNMDERKFEETQRHNRASEANAAAGLGIRQGALDLARKREGRIGAGGGAGGGGISGMSDSDLIRMATGD